MQCILEKSDEFENSYPLLCNIFFLILIMLLLGLQQLCSSCWLLHLLWNNNKAFVLHFGRANKKNYCRLCVVYIRERRNYVKNQPQDLLERVFHTKGKSFIATNSFRTFWTNDRMSMRYTYFSCRELCLAIDFLIDNIYVRFGRSVFRHVIGIPMGTNSAPLLADLFLHTFEYDFMVKTMKHDITKAIQFSNTFRYIDDLFSINNVDFGNYISAIYPPELQLTDTSTSSTEVCYLDTHIKTGGTNTPFRISIYDKRDDFTFRIVNFPHMDSNIPANPAYGVYISQLVRYATICTSKVDFMNRLRGLCLRLRQ